MNIGGFSLKNVGNLSNGTNQKLIIITLFFVTQITLMSTAPVSGQALQVDVWTNKGGIGIQNIDGGTYIINESIVICVNINVNVDRLRIRIIMPDGSDVVRYDNPITAGTHCILRGIIGDPPGVRRVIAEVWVGNLSAYDEVWYNVIGGCPRHGMYLGVDIRIINDEDVELTGWFKPLGVSWKDFVDFCWNVYPGRDYYIISYLRDSLLNPMFGIKSSSIIGSGLDELGQKVWLKLRVKFKDLSFSDHELKIMRFRDPVKSARKGFIDEVHLTSFRDIWKVSPQPTSRGAQSADWINRDAASAPLEYEVYLNPIISLKVRVEGIPSDITVSISINGINVGNIDTSRYMEKNLLAGNYTVQVHPEVIQYREDARYRCKNSLYRVTGSEEIVFKYNVEYKVIIRSTSGAGLSIDGIYYGFKDLPFEDWWEEGSEHRIIADEVGEQKKVSEAERTVSRFSIWSDGIVSRERNLRISGPVNLIAEYITITQYYVNVESNYGNAIGDGWYDSGSMINIWLEGYVIEYQKILIYISNRERVVFRGWSGDLTSQNVWESLIVDSPKFIKANWEKQYYVETITSLSRIEGSGWYSDGDVARIALVETVVYTPDGKTRYLFEGWRGDYSGTEKEFPIVVNRPLVIEAKWFAEHLVELSTNPEFLIDKALELKEKWVRSGDRLSIVAKQEIQLSSDTKYTFTSWSIGGDILSSREVHVTVKGPMLIVANYEPWYYILVKTDYGAASGSGWYKSGSEARISIEPLTVGFLITQVFDGWVINGKLISKEAEYKLMVDGPLIVTAKWRTDYIGLMVLTAILGTTFCIVTFVKIGGVPIYIHIIRIISGKAGVEQDVRRYDACINCGIILPPSLEGNTCPNCGTELVGRIILDIPTACPNCKAEISTIPFGSQLKGIRCSECGYTITPERRSQQ